MKFKKWRGPKLTRKTPQTDTKGGLHYSYPSFIDDGFAKDLRLDKIIKTEERAWIWKREKNALKEGEGSGVMYQTK